MQLWQTSTYSRPVHQDRHIGLPVRVFLIGCYNQAIHTYMFFFLAWSLVLTHEMDAIRRHEWNIFPGLSCIKDEERGCP